MKMQCLLPATPNSTFVEQEPEPHYETSASKSKAMPLKAAQIEVEPSKVAVPEACMHRISPVVIKPEHVRAFYSVSSFHSQKCKCPISICF